MLDVRFDHGGRDLKWHCCGDDRDSRNAGPTHRSSREWTRSTRCRKAERNPERVCRARDEHRMASQTSNEICDESKRQSPRWPGFSGLAPAGSNGKTRYVQKADQCRDTELGRDLQIVVVSIVC